MSFDHLDDPEGFEPDDRFRAAAQRDGRRRRTRRRLALAGGSVLTSVVVVVAAVAGYGLWRTSQIDRVDVEFVAPPVTLDEPFNILLIGSDSRAGTELENEVTGARSDTMMVVRVVPAERRVLLLSLPRDLALVPLDGGGPERLNTALTEGDASRLVETIETRLGIPLSAYVEVDFDGLVDLVDAVGGIPLAVTATVRDQSTGLWLEPASCAVLDGESTLALVRSRHLERLDSSGRWTQDLTSDIGRMARQRAVIGALVPELGELTDGLGGLEASIALAADHLVIDDRLDLGTLLALGRWANIGTPAVEGVELPLAPLILDSGASVLVLADGSDAAVAMVGGALPGATTDGIGAPGDDLVVEPAVVPAAEMPISPCP